MKIIADAGATKIHWALIHKSDIIQFSTSGFNPNISDSNYLRQLLISGFPEQYNPADVLTIWYYGTGCGSELGKQRVFKALKSYFSNEAEIIVMTDLEGAAKAAFGNTEGIVGILGTGANAGYYNGTKIIDTLPSLGYLLGDEGSGFYLGRLLVQKIIRDELPTALIQNFYKNYNLTGPDLVSNVYSASKPNAFLASFTTFLTENIHNIEIENIVNEGFNEYYNKYLHKIVATYKNSPIIMVGGIASVFKNQLSQVLKKQGIEKFQIIESPLLQLIERI